MLTLAAVSVAEVAACLKASTPHSLDIEGFRRAGVLVPVLEAPGGLELLFTVRSSKLSSHAGEVAFPGGGVDPGETHVEAALRETFEEVGLRVSPDDVIGRLSDHPSPAGYVATPIVARVKWPQELELNSAEVASVFTVPLIELAAIEPTTRAASLSRYRRLLYSYPWGEHNIWGFTGNVVRELLEVLSTGGVTPREAAFDPE